MKILRKASFNSKSTGSYEKSVQYGKDVMEPRFEVVAMRKASACFFAILWPV